MNMTVLMRLVGISTLIIALSMTKEAIEYASRWVVGQKGESQSLFCIDGGACTAPDSAGA